jgi:hypothetical protein
LKEPVFFIDALLLLVLGKLPRILHKAPKVAESEVHLQFWTTAVRTETHWHFLQNRLNPAILS